MAKTKSSTSYRSILLVLSLVFWVSLETAAKDGKFSAGRNDIKGKTGVSSAEWLESPEDEAHKRAIGPAKAPSTGPGFIYIIKMVGKGGARPQKYVKVGFSVNPAQRLRNLAAGNPFSLEIVATWKVTNMTGAEALAHTALVNKGLQVEMGGGTEWFRLLGGSLQKLHDLVDTSIQPYLDPNQAGAIAATSFKY